MIKSILEDQKCNAMDEQIIRNLDIKYPNWRKNSIRLLKNPNIMLDSIKIIFKHSGLRYSDLLSKTTNMDVLHWVLNSGYNNWTSISQTAARLGDLKTLKLSIDNYYIWCSDLLYKCSNKLELLNIQMKLLYSNIATYAVKGGNIDIFNLAMLHAKDEFNWNDIAKYATRSGHLDIVNLAISKGANNWSNIAIEASKSGVFELVNISIDNGNLHNSFHILDKILEYATKKGYINIVKLVMYKGGCLYNATDAVNWSRKDILELSTLGRWQNIAEIASVCGYIDILELAIANLGNCWNDWNRISILAAKTGNIDIVKLSIQHGANNINEIAGEAAQRHYLDILDLAINIGIDVWDYISSVAATSGHIDIVILAIENGAKNLDKIASSAAYCGHIDIVRLAIDKGSTNFNKIAINATYGDHLDIVKLALEKGADNFDELIIYASNHHYLDIIELGKSLGLLTKDNWNDISYSAAIFGYLDLVELSISNGASNLNDISAITLSSLVN